MIDIKLSDMLAALNPSDEDIARSMRGKKLAPDAPEIADIVKKLPKVPHAAPVRKARAARRPPKP